MKNEPLPTVLFCQDVDLVIFYRHLSVIERNVRKHLENVHADCCIIDVLRFDHIYSEKKPVLRLKRLIYGQCITICWCRFRWESFNYSFRLENTITVSER